MLAPFTLSRAQVTITAPDRRPQRLGRLAFSYDGTQVTVKGRRSQVLAEGAVTEAEKESSQRWSFTLDNGDVWSVKKGCGCGG